MLAPITAASFIQVTSLGERLFGATIQQDEERYLSKQVNGLNT